MKLEKLLFILNNIVEQHPDAADFKVLLADDVLGVVELTYSPQPCAYNNGVISEGEINSILIG